GLLATNEINIANMKVYRSSKGGNAMMVIETDQEIPAELESLIDGLDKIRSATLLYPI
ncbi:MAG: L-serine ammonia-lyase, iron-sulfur-dependent, subunit beta, partial [Firmicutes bacterium HGW-Firmicutes-11]